MPTNVTDRVAIWPLLNVGENSTFEGPEKPEQNLNLALIRPFYDFAFFETACGQIWPFKFFRTW